MSDNNVGGIYIYWEESQTGCLYMHLYVQVYFSLSYTNKEHILVQSSCVTALYSSRFLKKYLCFLVF